MNVTVKSNWFGRPYKAFAHHYVSIGFDITGGSGSYEFRRQLYGGWTAWQDVVEFGNKDGYAIHSYLFHLAFPIEVRDKNNTATVWSNPNFELLYNNNLTAIHMGTTPVIVDASLAVGATSITVKGTATDFIQIYKSNGAEFDHLSEPVASGFLGLGATKAFTIPPAVAGDKYVATATSRDPINNRTYSFESLSSQWIEVGGTKKIQLEATIQYTADTSTGKFLKVTSVTGGSGNYAIGRLNNGTFDVAVNQVFDIPFGVDNIFIRDVNAPNDEHISVLVYGGTAPSGAGQTYNYNLRTDFSSSSANQDKTGFRVKYGKKVGSTFTQFDQFGNFDNRQAWAMASDADGMPQIGIDENQGTLAGNRILMHPHTDGNATVLFEILKAGTFQFNGDSVRAARTDNPWSSPPQSGMSGTLKIIHNGTERVSILLNTQDEVKAISTGFAVSVGDIVHLEMQNTSGDGSFGHYHVSGGLSLVEQGSGTVTAPAPPTISGATPRPKGTILTGTVNGAGQHVIIFRNDVAHSLAITDGAGNFSFGAMYAGTYTARNSTAQLISLDSNAIVITETASVCPLPTISIENNQPSNTIQAGGGFGLTATFTNKTSLQWYKDGIALSGETGQMLTISLAQVTHGGTYKCKAINACGTGTTSEVFSNEIVITVTSGSQIDCANIVHLTPLGVWSASPNTPFKAVKFSNTGSKPFVGQITSENPLKFVIRGKNSVGSINLQGNQFVWASGIDGTVVNCLGGADTGIGGLTPPTDFPMPPNYEVVGGVYQPISGGTGTTKNMRIPAKMPAVSPCNTAVLQFGYSNAQSTQPTNWADSDGVVRLLTSGGVTVEVSSGGDLYQYKEFPVLSGTYHCFTRQKDDTSNVVYIGAYTVS